LKFRCVSEVSDMTIGVVPGAGLEPAHLNGQGF